MLLSEIYERILDAFFPTRCIFCDKVSVIENGVCSQCSQKVLYIEEPVCRKCGMNKKKCRCKNESHFFDGICAPFEYSGPVRKGIHIFKFDGHSENSRYMSNYMSDCVKKNFPDVEFDVVTNVPMTKNSEKKRSYNQSALLAQGVAKNLSLVYDDKVLVKLYETKTQHLLSNVLRRGNLAGVFDVPNINKVKDKIILICDDVSTTGETLDECSKMLYLAGAKEIYCSVFALTQFEEKKKGDKTNARN